MRATTERAIHAVRCTLTTAALAAGLTAGLASAPSAAIGAQGAPPVRPQVMILGSYHMANPGRDLANVAADDVLSTRRQAEIEELVNRLAAFKPTHVALEYVPARDSLMNARYTAFRAGTYTLARNESEQVGFRVASRAGLARVKGIDNARDLDFQGMMRVAGESGQQGFLAWLQQGMMAAMAQSQKEMQTLPVTGILAAMNDPQRKAQMHSAYLRAAIVGRDSMYAGADVAEDWYGRNLRILGNLQRLVDSPGARVLVIIGVGHAPILERMINDAGEWEIVDPLPLLARP